MTEVAAGPRSTGAWLATYALAVALAIAAYLPGLPGEFVYDDHRLIVDNEGLRRPLDLRRALLRDYYASDADRMGLGYYRPVALLSNELDFRRGGGTPLPFHGTNLLLHAACTALVVALARRCLGGGAAVAGIAGVLFALHPAHAESVAFISGRVDPLATLFGLTAILLHLRAATAHRPGPWRLGAGCAWLAALLSKEIAITIPALAVCAEIARGGHPPARAWRAWLARVVPYGAALVPYLVLRSMALGGLLAGSDPAAPTGRLLEIPVVLGSYLAWLALPPPGLHLEPGIVGGLGRVLAVAVLLAVVAAGVVLARRGSRLEPALLVWCVLALLPVAQIRPLETELSERFLYLPSVGACLLFGAVARRVSRRIGRAGALAAACVVAIAYTSILVPRTLAWRDSIALWSAKARADPASLKAQLNLGRAFARRGDVERSRAAYERAAVLVPGMADTARAEFESLTGPKGGANEQTVRRALESAPTDAALWSNLGFALLQKGDSAGAAEAFTQAVALVPARSSAWLGLALAQLRLGRVDPAIDAARRSLTLNPDLDLAQLVLAEAKLRKGLPCEALRDLEGASFDSPEEAAARDRIAQLARDACAQH